MIRFVHRGTEALHFALPLEPPTKKTRPGTRKKASELLATAFETDTLIQYTRQHTSWPKPRAAVALDIAVFGARLNGPRIDSICKWLLDELSGRVYADDRQVKLLFARTWRPSSLSAADLTAFWGEAGPPTPETIVNRSAMTYITAQTRANILADLRTASRLEERWDPFDDDQGGRYADPVHASFRRDSLVDYRAMLDPDDERDAGEHRLIGYQIDYTDQIEQQRLVDLIFSSLFTRTPVDEFKLWSRVRDLLAYGPYIFDLGVLPERGGSATFQQNLQQLLQSRRQQFPGLFPLRATSGISMILFEDPRTGKDLDNLVRTVLPDVLNVLRPPSIELPGWIAEEPDPSTGAVDIPFLEVAALPSKGTDMPAGSVIFGLSSGHRHQSWWAGLRDHIDRTLERQRP